MVGEYQLAGIPSELEMGGFDILAFGLALSLRLSKVLTESDLWDFLRVTAKRIRAKYGRGCLSINGCPESGPDHEQSDLS